MSDEGGTGGASAQGPQGEQAGTITPEQAKAEADAARAAGDDLAAIKAEARKWEAQAKANADAAKRLAEIEESQKTEAQKTADRLAALEAENADYKQREQIASWAAEITKDSPVPAEALRGTTREELEEHHALLASLIKAPKGPVIPGQGKTPTFAGAASADDWLRGIAG